MKQPQAHRNGFYNTSHLSFGVRAGESRVRFRASRRAIIVSCLACVLVSRFQSSAHGLRETGSVAGNGWIVLGERLLRSVTCRQCNNSGALPVAQHPELWQLHLVAHTDAGQPIFPMVPNVSHCVPDSGDMPNTQNAITYAAKHRVSLTRLLLCRGWDSRAMWQHTRRSQSEDSVPKFSTIIYIRIDSIWMIEKYNSTYMIRDLKTDYVSFFII